MTNIANMTNNANNAHADENVSDVSDAANNQRGEMRIGKPILLNVSDVSDHGLTPDQSRRVQDLIAEGMAPKFARAEVLGRGL